MNGYQRGIDTAVAAWVVWAAGVAGAQVHRDEQAVAAIFPTGPERAFLNNAVLDQGLAGTALSRAVDQVEHRYADAGVDRFAVWVTDDDAAALQELQRRGYTLDTSTAAMALEVDGPVPALAFEPGSTTWVDYVEAFLPGGLLARTDPKAFHVVTALLDGAPASVAIAFEEDGDLGIYNVSTHEHARRRGLATALTNHLVNVAVDHGCTTATLQSTPMAERVYAACGFRTVARILEYVPG